MNELFLSVSLKGRQISINLQSKVVAKGERKKQVARFLLFLWIKAEHEGLPCVSSWAYANEANGIPMTCSWAKLSIVCSALMLESSLCLPVRSWCLLVLGVGARCGSFIRWSHLPKRQLYSRENNVVEPNQHIMLHTHHRLIRNKGKSCFLD